MTGGGGGGGGGVAVLFYLHCRRGRKGTLATSIPTYLGVLRTKPTTFHMLGKSSTTESRPNPYTSFLEPSRKLIPMTSGGTPTG